jgi:hypothetical protein
MIDVLEMELVLMRRTLYIFSHSGRLTIWLGC